LCSTVRPPPVYTPDGTAEEFPVIDSGATARLLDAQPAKWLRLWAEKSGEDPDFRIFPRVRMLWKSEDTQDLMNPPISLGEGTNSIYGLFAPYSWRLKTESMQWWRTGHFDSRTCHSLMFRSSNYHPQLEAPNTIGTFCTITSDWRM